MSTTPHAAGNAAAGPDQAEADLYARLSQTLIAAEGAIRQPDGWLSLLRGRLLAVASSSVGLYFAGAAAWGQWQHLQAEGPTPEHTGALLTQIGVLWDHGDAVILALTSCVSMLAAGVSWLRGRQAARTG